MNKFITLAVVLALSAASGVAGEKFPELSGPYLGQQPPAMEPQVFAPGIVSTALNTRDMAISPDGKEIYFCVNLANYTFSTILVTRLQNGSWSEPEVMRHMEDPDTRNIEPCISPDGKRFFFMSNRPDISKGETKGDEDIWVMERNGDSWGQP